MIIIKASTAKGQNIIARCESNQGYTLSDVYTNYSSAKVKAYNWCKEQYENTENFHGFKITGSNCMAFSVSWKGTKDGEPILRYETKENSYMVLLNQ